MLFCFQLGNFCRCPFPCSTQFPNALLLLTNPLFLFYVNPLQLFNGLAVLGHLFPTGRQLGLQFLFLLLQLNRLFLASRFCFCQLLFLLSALLQPLLLFCNLLLLTQICLLQLCRCNLTGGQLFPNSCLFRRQSFLLLFGFLLLSL